MDSDAFSNPSQGVRGVGLDLATRTSGVFVSLDGQPVKGWLVKASGAMDMALKVQDALDEVGPTWVAIEGTYFQKNVATKALLDELRGAVRAHITRRGWGCYVGKTAQIDSACSLAGGLPRKARKRATQTFARQVTGGDWPEDVADALAVLWWGMGEYRKDTWLRTGQG